MTFFEFDENKDIQRAAEAYLDKFGGGFYCEEPGERLLYTPEGSKISYYPPDDVTSEQMVTMLQNEKSLSEQWNQLKYEADLIY